jgi:hypothetical protein
MNPAELVDCSGDSKKSFKIPNKMLGFNRKGNQRQ